MLFRSGFLPKRMSTEALADALKLVMEGGIFVPPLQLADLMAVSGPGSSPAPDAVYQGAISVDDLSVFPNFVAMPEEGGAHVVLLDDRRLLMSADCPQSAALLRARGYETVEVDISEYVKLEGCVTCLSVRLRDAPAR